SVSTERTSTTQFEESSTQDTTTEAIASVSTERTSTTQFEESTTQDTTTEAITSVFTAEQFKRSTIEDAEVVLSDTTEKLMSASAAPQGFFTKTITGSMGVFLALLAFLGFAVARKRKSGVYRVGEKEDLISKNNSLVNSFSEIKMNNLTSEDDSFIVDMQDTEESKI
ncbi:MAG: hypothetical protein ACRDAI_00305, partial [Candidatus Rhabdochlamydia sp.]